jgi:hypothetical protein
MEILFLVYILVGYNCFSEVIKERSAFSEKDEGIGSRKISTL